MKLKQIVLSGLMAASVVTTASAAIYNDSPSTALTTTDLQNLFDASINGAAGTLSASNDQTGAAGFIPTDANSSTTYLISLLGGTNTFSPGAPGNLGIYSFATSEKIALVGLDSTGFQSASIGWNTNGSVKINNGWGGTSSAGFGKLFGFYYVDGATTYYSEDTKNNGESRALSYLLDDGVSFVSGVSGTNDIGTTAGNDDWLLAFDSASDGSGDFNDAVFFIKDVTTPVPAPAALALMGLGLLGFTAARRRQKTA